MYNVQNYASAISSKSNALFFIQCYLNSVQSLQSQSKKGERKKSQKMSNNYTMADSEETPVLYLHSKGETMYDKIYNLLVAFCLFVLACFIGGLALIKSEVQHTIEQTNERTIKNEFEKIEKRLFPGRPGSGKQPRNSDDEDEDNDKSSTASQASSGGTATTASLIWTELNKKDQQQNENKGNVVFSGNKISVNGKGTGKRPQSRQIANGRRCGYCGLYPYAPEGEHDEIFPIHSNASNYSNYTGGMIHNIQGNNEASNNARISAYNRKSKNLWEEVTNRDELHTNLIYFRGERNCP